MTMEGDPILVAYVFGVLTGVLLTVVFLWGVIRDWW